MLLVGGTYEVTYATMSDNGNAGTHNQLTLYLHGTMGTSGPLVVKPGGIYTYPGK